jgi:hypothetical protein
MEKSEMIRVVEEIESTLKESREMWRENINGSGVPSKAFIIGFLEGSLKSLKSDLNIILNKDRR